MGNITAPIRLSPQVQPGKQRDTFLQQQMSQIQDALNQLLAPQPVRKVVIANDAILDTDWWIVVDCTNSNVVLTLPLAVNGIRAVGVKKIDATVNTVTIKPTGTDKVENAGGVTLSAQYQSVTIVPDGKSNWWEFA